MNVRRDRGIPTRRQDTLQFQHSIILLEKKKKIVFSSPSFPFFISANVNVKLTSTIRIIFIVCARMRSRLM